MPEKDTFAGSYDFIQLKPKAGYYEKPVGRPGDDYIPTKLEYEKREEDGEWASKDFKQQVGDTSSYFEKKSLKKDNEVFYILSSAYTPANSKLEKALKRLSTNTLAYLDEKHARMLVSGSSDILKDLTKKDIPKYVKESFHMIRPLQEGDYFSTSLKGWKKGKMMVIITIPPNLEKKRSQEYLKSIKDYLKRQNSEIYDSGVSGINLLFTKVDYSTVKDLVNKSTFVHKIHAVPQSFAQKMKSSKNITHKKKAKIASAAGFDFPEKPKNTLPIITVLDSGLNQIQELNGLIIRRTSFINANLNDEKEEPGHGTPISILSTYGEDLKIPVARIISHKIWSPKQNEDGYNGMINGVETYCDVSKIFVSSINFEESLDDELLTELNHLIQEKNICFILSAGNIPPMDCVNFIQKNIPYRNYHQKYPVSSPSDAPFIIAVGGIAKKVTKNPQYTSISQINANSPFSRCGFGTRPLLDCKKPEVVDNGGNINKDNSNGTLNSEKVGVTSISKSGVIMDDLKGTSFSAPLFARKIAGIYGNYKQFIRNAETMTAIALISPTGNREECQGWGEPSSFIGCSHNNALYFAEGTIRLSEKKGNKIGINYDEIEFKVSHSIGHFDVCVVHSDNFKLTTIPSLNTWLKIDVWKWGRDSKIDPLNKEKFYSKSNIKKLKYGYKKKNMKSVWKIRITPQLTSEVRSIIQKNIMVRYGCAILLSRKSSKPSVYSVEEELKAMKISEVQ